MKVFYSGTFVLPLPERHRVPMAKDRLLRPAGRGTILSAGELHVPEPIASHIRTSHPCTARSRCV